MVAGDAYDLVVVGAGLAGLTAGMVAGRFGLRVAIVDPGTIGGQVLNVEKIDVLAVSHETVKTNPPCPVCGSRMKSEGRGKGFQCKKGGQNSTKTARAKAATRTR